MADKHVKEPIRVVTVNESVTGSGSGVEPGPEGAVRAPSSGQEATVLDTVPKTMQAKARRLMEHLKRDIAWTARGELIHEGVPVVGSNVVDLVNDLLRKRKTDPPGWQPFARQLRAINLPMELVGNVVRKAYDDGHSLSSVSYYYSSCCCWQCTKITKLDTPRSSAPSNGTFHAHPTPRIT